jgi:hypothetical protein
MAPPGLASFFRLSDAWELSELQQCKLLHCPSVAVLGRYRAGQGPRLTAVQQKRIALLAGIHAALANRGVAGDRVFRWAHEPQRGVPYKGETPVHYMMAGGVPAIVEVAKLLSRS